MRSLKVDDLDERFVAVQIALEREFVARAFATDFVVGGGLYRDAARQPFRHPQRIGNEGKDFVNWRRYAGGIRERDRSHGRENIPPPARRWRPQLVGRLVLHSANGTSNSSPSFATLTLGKTSRASRTNSSALIENRAETCERTNRFAFAASATCAASFAVECPVSRARSRSSSPNVASWIRRSAPCAASTVAAQGRVSPVNATSRPGLAAPTKPSAVSVLPSASSTVSPLASLPQSGPSGMPAAFAFSTSNRPRRTCSFRT